MATNKRVLLRYQLPHPGDEHLAVVLTEFDDGAGYGPQLATWLLNERDGGFNHGHYHRKDAVAAAKNFTDRADYYRGMHEAALAKAAEVEEASRKPERPAGCTCLQYRARTKTQVARPHAFDCAHNKCLVAPEVHHMAPACQLERDHGGAHDWEDR